MTAVNSAKPTARRSSRARSRPPRSDISRTPAASSMMPAQASRPIRSPISSVARGRGHQRRRAARDRIDLPHVAGTIALDQRARNRRGESAPTRGPTATPPRPASRPPARAAPRPAPAPTEIATVVASGSSPRLIAAFQPAWQAAANSTAAKTKVSMAKSGHEAVMAGLVPGQSDILCTKPKDVDARHKAGHDEFIASERTASERIILRSGRDRDPAQLGELRRSRPCRRSGRSRTPWCRRTASAARRRRSPH